MTLEITDAMIQRALCAPTLGDENSVIADYITSPGSGDPDWKAVGGYTKGLHPSYACTDWQWHIIRRILEAALVNGEIAHD